MEYYLLRKIDIDNLLRVHPEALEVIQANRLTEPVQEAPNFSFRLIPGTERHLMALPQCSLINGPWDEPWFIDTGLTTEEFGAIYIGRSDFNAMANLAGYTEVENVRKAQTRVEELERENERLQSVIDSVAVVRRNLNNLQSDELPGPNKADRKRSAAHADGTDSKSAA